MNEKVNMTMVNMNIKKHLPIKFNIRDAGTLLGLVIIFLVFSFLSPVFFSVPNLLNILLLMRLSHWV